MKMPLHPAALEELIEAVDFYESRQPGLGGDFFGEVEAGVDAILDAPERWPLIHHANGVRGYLLSRFPYRLCYRRFGKQWQIVAVAHTSRQPDYWRERS